MIISPNLKTTPFNVATFKNQGHHRLPPPTKSIGGRRRKQMTYPLLYLPKKGVVFPLIGVCYHPFCSTTIGGMGSSGGLLCNKI